MASSLKTRTALAALLIAIVGAGIWLSFRERSEAAGSTPITAIPPRNAQPEHAVAPAAAVPSETSAPSVISTAGTPTPALSASVANPVPSVAPTAAATPTQPSAAGPVPQSAEVRSTRAMYMAHAPLRAPAVADPDSEQNRQILQSMVTKALSRASQAQPATNK
jgi:hypothetical protein